MSWEAAKDARIRELEKAIGRHVDEAIKMQGELNRARAESARLREALEDANDKCRSAYQIAAAYARADRTAGETNWRAFRDRLRESLGRQRAALSGDKP